MTFAVCCSFTFSLRSTSHAAVDDRVFFSFHVAYRRAHAHSLESLSVYATYIIIHCIALCLRVQLCNM